MSRVDIRSRYRGGLVTSARPVTLGKMSSQLFGRSMLGAAVFSSACLTVLAWEFDHFRWDLELSRLVQDFENPALIPLMFALSWLGAGWVPWLLGISTGLTAYWLKRELKRWALVLWGGLAAGALVMYFLKELTQRPRPAPPFVQVLIEYSGFSYPSGHVIFFVQYFGFLLLLGWCLTDRIIWRVTLALIFGSPILLVGVSRVYMGAHWPSDVVGGYLVGAVLLALMVGYFRSSQIPR